MENRSLLASVLTYHNDAGKTGQNLEETILTRSNVNVNTFGKVFSVPLDGDVYAQPLVKEDVNITAGPHTLISPDQYGEHDTVFVPTQHGSLYAIDGSTGAILWKRYLLDVTLPGATSVGPVRRDDVGSGYPEMVTTGTPVIDPTTNRLFVLTKSREVVDGKVHFVHRIHAINISDGTASISPFLIGDTVHEGNQVYVNNTSVWVHGTGDGNDGNGRVYFNSLRQFTRTALTLFDGVLYAGWASHESRGPYHGWVIGFDAQTLALRAAFNTTPNGGLGGIWQAGGGLASDGTALYFQTANGSFGGNNGNLITPKETGTVTGLDANGFPVNGNYGNSILKVVPDATSTVSNQNINGWGLKVVDYFTPFNQKYLEDTDLDLGSGAPMLLPAEAGSAAHPNLLVGAGKQGIMYLVDRDNMGKFGTRDNVVQVVGGQLSSSFDTAAYYQNKIYYVEGFGGTAKTFSIVNGVMSSEPTSRSHDTFTYAGSTPSISANGSVSGIVWDVDRGTNQLRAYSADTYATQLYHSGQAAGNRDLMGSAATFQVPTIANGFVYLGTASGSTSTLVAYGLIEPPTSSPAAPSDLKATSILGTQVTLSWQRNDSSPNIASGYVVEKSSDGGQTWTSLPAGTATSLTAGGLQTNTTYRFRVSAYNSIGSSNTSSAINITTTADAGGIDYSAGFDSTAAATLGGGVLVENSALVLTTGEPNEFTGVFTRVKQDITKFSTAFDFHITAGPSANGFTFTIQSDNPAVDAGGWQTGGAEGLAYGSVAKTVFPHSLAIKFDLFRALDVYEYSGDYINTTGLYVNGAMPTTPEFELLPSGIDLHSGHRMAATIDYDSGAQKLTLTIVDTVTNAQFSKVFSEIDLPEIVGGGSAYVGFTAASGRNANAAARQRILNWKFAPEGPPTPPTSLRTQVNGQVLGMPDEVAPPMSVEIAWTGVDGATSYTIERRFGLVGNYELVATVPGDTTSYVNTGVSTQLNYFYRIKASNGAGDSAYSTEVVATTPGRVPTPRFGTPTAVTATSITMQWQDESLNEDGFHIKRRVDVEDGSPYVLVGVLPPHAGMGLMSFTDTGLNPSTKYDYHIEAFNLVGYNDYTGVNTTTLPLSGPPQAYFQHLSTPRNTAASALRLHFSSPVSGFDKSDLSLTRNGTSVSLASAIVTPVDTQTWSVDLTAVPAIDGDYVLTLTAAGSGIVDSSSAALSGDAQLTWSFDSQLPSIVSFAQVSPGPGVNLTNAETLVFALQFSEPVSAFSLKPLLSFGLMAQDPVVTTSDNQNFVITFEQLAGTGSLRLELNAASNLIRDFAGNAVPVASYPAALQLEVDRVAPSVAKQTVLIEKGSSRTLTAAMLLASDARVSLAGLIYTVKSLPANVVVRRGGVALQVNDTFTQLDINTLNVLLVHNNDSSTSDTMTFTISDGLNESALQTLDLGIVPVNTPPTVPPMPVQETRFETELIVKDQNGAPLTIVDPDAAQSSLKVTLRSAFGRVTLASTAGLTILSGTGTLDPEVVFTGSLTDINNALNGLKYTPRLGYTGAEARIDMIVNDQGNDGASVPKSTNRQIRITVLPWVINGNTLRVAGTGGNDTMSISVDATQVHFVTGDTTYVFDRDGINTIGVYGYPGNDQITINSTGGLAVNVFSADGNDTIFVASSVSSKVTLNGGSGDDQITGGSGADFITGGDGNDVLAGGGGADRYIFGNVASSVIETDTVLEFADGGVDLLDFGALSSAVKVDLRSDTALATHVRRKVVTGGAGQAAHLESASGGTGDDIIWGNDANNWLGGSIGDDALTGFLGNDTLVGGEGNDKLTGGSGNDKLMGGKGNDDYLFAVVAGSHVETDTITELADEGVDALNFSGLATAVESDLSSNTAIAKHLRRNVFAGVAGQSANLENVTGGSADDTLTGNSAANVLIGTAGHDRLNGGDGSDRLAGGSGDDTYVFDMVGTLNLETDTVVEFADQGVDNLDFSALTIFVNVDLNSDTMLGRHSFRQVMTDGAGQAANLENAIGGAGKDMLIGNANANVLSGSGGDDTLLGNAGNDTLLGGADSDKLTGGAGDDRLVGGSGDDYYTFENVVGETSEVDRIEELVDGGRDSIGFASVTTSVSVDLNLNWVVASHLNRKVLTAAAGQGANLELIAGGSADDQLVGNAVDNWIGGNGGNDGLSGGVGNDSLVGGDGHDRLNGSEGNDRLLGGNGDDSYLFYAVQSGVAENDTVIELANQGNDTLGFSSLTVAVTANLFSDASLAGHELRTIATGSAGQAANFEHVLGGTADDILAGNFAANTLIGNGGNDVLFGGFGNDTLDGGQGNDRLAGGDGDDLMRGGAGDDIYEFRPVASGAAEVDTLVEYVDGGSDTLDFGGLTTAVTVNLNQGAVASHEFRTVEMSVAAQAANLENVIGGSAGDDITGNKGVNALVGNDGNDTLRGDGNRDILIGGSGADLLRGNSNQDVLVAGGLSFQNNPAGLNAIRNEWRQPTEFQTRIDHLMGVAGGLNGAFAIKSITVLDDAEADSLFGEGDLDWFWADLTEVKDIAVDERRDP